MRYTFKMAREELAPLNVELLSMGGNNKLEVSARNGYYGLDLYRMHNDGRFHCQRTLATGSVRECMAAARDFHKDQLIEQANITNSQGLRHRMPGSIG